MSRAKQCLTIGAMALGLAPVQGWTRDREAIDFNRDIRPLLSDKCFFCHGPDSHERKADLRLDTAEGATRDLGGYAAIVPGKPEASELVLRISDAEDPMPPKDSHKKLEPDQVELLTRWVKEGALYSEPWAYVAPKRSPVPEVTDGSWPAHWVDHFVLAKLEEENLAPSPEADAVTLVRRLHFDLTGLPPRPEVVEAFVKDRRDREVVWGELVNDLLDTPHFGERMAMYWLDLVRFADTVGYHGDQDHNISPYRDWVVQSLAENLPFDQFTREQLAGDLLPEPTLAQKVASGYNRLLQTSHEGGVQLKEYDAIYAADRVRNLSAVWMGATVGCAQCHDHKYDPYTLKDHYALAAFFADIHDRGFGGNSLPSKRPPEIAVYSPEEEARKAELTKQLETLLPAETRTRLQSLETEERKLKEAVAKTKTPEKRAELETRLETVRQQTLAAAPEEKRLAWRKWRGELDRLEKGVRRTMITVAQPPRTMRVLPRGNWLDDSGEIVTPAVPSFLGHLNVEGRRPNRLDLANWLTDPEQGSGGLTARVMANRFWYLFFGSGISRSLEDFGGQGEPPANPELLDNLAVAFVESGWDMKALVRLLVTSRAYRQSSLEPSHLRERDPHNQLVARQSRYRLPAEMIRDNALAISGLLELGGDGRSVKPYQPAGYYRHLNFPQRKYSSDQDAGQWRRGLYVHWQRQFLHPMLKAMDAPSREECTAQRPRSNTPTAALVLLNDPTFVEAARMFATRMMERGGTEDGERIRYGYREALSRFPDKEEQGVLQNLLAVSRAQYQGRPEEAAALMKTGLKPPPPEDRVLEVASWTSVARAILNLNETVTRN